MNTLSRTITGSILIFFGIILIIITVFINEAWWLLIYGIPIFIIGFFILFNKHEDKIEERRDMKGGKRKK